MGAWLFEQYSHLHIVVYEFLDISYLERYFDYDRAPRIINEENMKPVNTKQKIYIKR